MRKVIYRKLLLIIICCLSLVLIGCQEKTIKVTNILITGNNEMIIGEKQTLEVTIYPDDATQKEYTIINSNDVVTVNGLEVTAAQIGTCVITVASTDKSNVVKTFEITVKEKECESIEITTSKNTIEIGEELTLQYLIYPADVTNANVTWTSDNEAVLSCNNGKIKGISEGSATITVTTNNKKTDSITFTVKKALLETSVLQGLLNSKYNEYKSSSIASASLTIINNDKVSTFDLCYEYENKTKVKQLCALFNSEKVESIYIKDGMIYMDMNESKGKYTLDDSEYDAFINNYNFDKFFSENTKYFSDNDFFENLKFDETISYTDKDNACYKYVLDIRNYKGTAFNIIGVDELCLYVTIVKGEVTCVECTSKADTSISKIKVEFKGLQCTITYPQDLNSYPDM